MFDILNFDWMGRGFGLFETVMKGPFAGHTFYISLNSGCTGARCEALLKEHDIGIYGCCIVQGDTLFTVEKDEAEEAERILLRSGVPLKYHLFSASNRRYLGGG